MIESPEYVFWRISLRTAPVGSPPSKPTRLADGLGPKRLPYAIRRCAPKTWFPRSFTPNEGLGYNKKILYSGIYIVNSSR
jgi:hypothetical protein